MAPTQFAFNFAVELVALYIATDVLECANGPVPPQEMYQSLAYMAAAIPGVAAVCQIPFALTVRRFGNKAKIIMMLIGLSSFTALGGLVMFNGEALRGWGYAIIVCYLLMGVGLASFEGANRATYADFF